MKASISARASLALFAALSLGPLSTQAATPAAGGPADSACPALWHRSALRLQDEKPQDLCQYRGKVVLVVNTASFCGFTPQYKALEALHRDYAARGLVVLGFPSNDFSQEPGSNGSIADFCENTFGVKFPMFTKTRVTGGPGTADPLFTELAKRSGSAPQWNFHKYLVSRDATAVKGFASRVDPSSKEFRAEVERLLAGPPLR